MGKNAEENSTDTFFTRVPHTWSKRKDVPLAMKVIVAYIYTRANIENLDWELVAADVVNLWGIGKSTVSRVIRDLVKRGVIQHTETRKIKTDEWASKIFKIDRQALHNLMNEKPDAVPPRNRTSSIVEPPQFRGETAAVPLGNLEEELKEENNKKSLKEEGKSELLSFFNKFGGPMPSKKSFEEQFYDIFGAVTSDEKKSQALSASAAFPSDNPTQTPITTDTKEETNDSSACPAFNAANNNHPIPSARPEKMGKLPVATSPRRSAVDELLSLPPTEQVKWLDAVEANESMVENLKAGKDVPMTEAFKDHFANW
jgi:hypothetical protein